MKILSNNKAGLNGNAKLHSALQEARKVDIAMFQETKLKRNRINMVKRKWGYDGVFMASCPGLNSRRGVLTLFSPRLNIQHLDVKEDNEGQFLINVFNYNEKIILLVNYYGDPDTDLDALHTAQKLDREIDVMEQKFHIAEKIVGGDFNFVLEDSDTDSQTRRPQTERYWRSMVEDRDLFDPESLFQTRPRRTYFRHRQEHIQARYDRFYTTQGLLNGAKLTTRVRTGDHTPIELTVLESDTGRGQWKMADSMLDTVVGNQIIQQEVGVALREVVDDPDEEIDISQLQHFVNYDTQCPLELLTSVISKVRNKLKEATRERQIKRRRNEKAMMLSLIDARNRYNNTHSQEDLEALEEKRDKLKMEQSQRAAEASERNYLQYAREGEKITNYHFNINMRGRPRREIRELNVPDDQGQVPNRMRTIDSGEVIHYMSEKFSEIAREDRTVGNTTIREYMGQDLAEEATKCPEHIKEMLISEINTEELKSAIDKMKNQSVPGPLGITNRLLKTLFPMIKEVMVKAGNKLLFSDPAPEVPRWLYHRKVVFIPKPGKDPKSEDSYRGLSMLENIFKAYSTILAQRMAKVLQYVQDPEQYGFTEGKSCMEPTRTIIDTIRHATQNNRPLVVLSTDLYKAFDTISHDHIERCMEFFEFPEEYKKAFMRMVRHGTLNFEINGHLSQDYSLDRGTGQGDPKSSFCFNLSVTPLNLYLSRSPEVPRYKIGEGEIGSVYFADDNGCIFDGSRTQGIIRTVRKVADYKDVSGLKLNLTKCEFLAINCTPECIQALSETGMKHVQRMKHLGVIIEQNGDVLEEQNFAPIVEKMESIATRFRMAGSSPIGRALYAKFLLGSRYVHRLQNGMLGERIQKQITEAMLYMTWTKARMNEEATGYRVHIAKARVMQPPSFGGLHLPSPQVQNTTLRMLWLKRFKEEFGTQGWYKILSWELERLRRPKIDVHMKLGTKEWRKTADKLEERSPYWANVFRAGELIQKLAIKHYKLWQMIPIFGSSEGDDVVTLASLEHENPLARPVIRSRLRVVGQLYKTNQVGHIDKSRRKTHEEVSNQFVGINPMLWTSMTGLTNEVRRKFNITMSTSTVRQTDQTALESIVTKYAKGCSAANRLLLRDDRERWARGPVPPSHHTYTRDGITQIEPDAFMAAFTSVYKSNLLPSLKWTSLQVLLRTLWTKVKESRSRGGDDRCLNCLAEAEHTIHMMFQCNLAHNVLEKIKVVINSDRSDDTEDIEITSDLVLFHKMPNGTSTQERADLIDVFMIYKHIIYRTRFRENIQNIPTSKLIIISMILELQKLSVLKNKNGESSESIIRLTYLFRREINWT